MKTRAVVITRSSVNQPLNHGSKLLCSGLLAALTAVTSAFAANQTWTNTPVSGAWQNTNNWVARGVPGATNLAGNTVQNDIATFNTPIPGSGFGGAASPILTDDCTFTNRSRQLGSIIFDTANCGAYVIDAATKPLSYPSNGILF